MTLYADVNVRKTITMPENITVTTVLKDPTTVQLHDINSVSTDHKHKCEPKKI